MTDDNHLRRIAQLDQAIAGLETVANVLGTYFTYLQNCGFQRKEAMLLIKDYQKKLLSFCFDAGVSPLIIDGGDRSKVS